MKPKQLFLILLSLTSLVIGGGLASWWLAHRALDANIADLQKLTSDIILENDQITRLQKLEVDYKRIEPLATKAQSVLPQQKQQAEVVAQISTIVRNNGLELSGLTFEATKGLPDDRSQTQSGSFGGILVMPMRFQTISTYSQLQSLLRNFEQQQRYMRVKTLEISRNDAGQLGSNITLEVFLKP